MVANIRGYTPNYGLKLINFDTPRWHTLEYSNWELVDAIMASTGLPGLRGEWINSTTYVAGERVFDAADGNIYGCLVTHTSAATGTFAADRAAHSTYWLLATLDTPRYRGNWAAGVAYSVADIVFINSYTYYICIANHTSSATFPPDAVKWTLVFDATAAVNTTNANATAAAGSATQAATSATNAATSATNAATSATDSAAQAQKLFGTSTSSVIVGLGGKTFITQASKYFNVGKFIMVRADVDPVNQWMWGQVTSYSGTSLVINAITSGGSGTYAAWTIDVSGSRGATGPQGPQGELGPPLIIKGTVPTSGSLPLSGNTIGDMYIATDNSHLYIWDGAQWDDAGPLGTSTTTTADAPPSNPKDGDMWWESDSGIFWVYYDDGNTSQWVQAGGAAASINQNFVLKTGDTMTGNLEIAKATPLITLRNTGGGGVAFLIYEGSISRWTAYLQEAGNNGDINIYRHDDAGTLVGSALRISRATGAVTLSSTVVSSSPATGALTVAGGLGVGGSIYATSIISGSAYLSVFNSAIGYGMALSTNNASINGGPLSFGNSASAQVGSVSYTSGQTGVAYNTASSAELKEDLKSFDAGNIIDNTNVYDFKWRSTEDRAYGVIAQQAVQVYPLAITHIEKVTTKGEERDEWWGVDYSKYVPVLLQELKALRARVAELEGKTIGSPKTPKRGR